MGEGEDAIDKLIANLDRIPKDITSQINISELSRKLAQELSKKISL